MKAKIRKIGGRWQWECREEGVVIYGSRATWAEALEVALQQLRDNYRWTSIQELRAYQEKWSV